MSSSPAAARPGCSRRFLEAARATADYYHRQHADRRRALLGHRRPGLAHLGAYLDRPADPVQRPRAGRQFRRRHRGAGSVRLGRYLEAKEQGGGRTLSCRRSHRGQDALQRTLSFDLTPPPGPPAAHGLPPSQRLGPRAHGAGRSPAARPACGAITTSANWRCWSPALSERQIPLHLFRRLNPSPTMIPAPARSLAPLHPHDHHQTVAGGGGGAALRRRRRQGHHGLAAGARGPRSRRHRRS